MSELSVGSVAKSSTTNESNNDEASMKTDRVDNDDPEDYFPPPPYPKLEAHYEKMLASEECEWIEPGDQVFRDRYLRAFRELQETVKVFRAHTELYNSLVVGPWTDAPSAFGPPPLQNMYDQIKRAVKTQPSKDHIWFNVFQWIPADEWAYDPFILAWIDDENPTEMNIERVSEKAHTSLMQQSERVLTPVELGATPITIESDAPAPDNKSG